MRKELLLVLCCFCLMLVGCSSDPYPDAPESVQGFVVPPYPGAAGRVGLDGVDSNNNGVRDDVERWILLEHGDKLDRRAIKIAFLRARASQKSLHSIANKEQARAFDLIDADLFFLLNDAISQSLEGKIQLYCSRETDKAIRNFTSGLWDQVANTRERAKAYARYNYLLGGGTYGLINPNKKLELKMENLRQKWDKEDGVASEPLENPGSIWEG